MTVSSVYAGWRWSAIELAPHNFSLSLFLFDSDFVKSSCYHFNLGFVVIVLTNQFFCVCECGSMYFSVTAWLRVSNDESSCSPDKRWYSIYYNNIWCQSCGFSDISIHEVAYWKRANDDPHVPSLSHPLRLFIRLSVILRCVFLKLTSWEAVSFNLTTVCSIAVAMQTSISVFFF